MPNFIFEPEKAEIFQITKRKKSYHSFIFKFLRLIVWFLGFLAIILWLIHLLGILQIEAAFLGLGLLLISAAAAILFLNSFYNFYFGYIPQKISSDFAKTQIVNLAEFLDPEAAEAVMEASHEARKRGLKSLNGLVLFLAFLKNRRILYILARAGINLRKLSAETNQSSEFIEAVKIAANFAQKEEHEQIGVGDLFYGLSQTDDFLKKVCTELFLNPEDVANIVYWENTVFSEQKERKKFLSSEFLAKTGGLGRDWAYGYTPTLSRYSFDISEAISRAGLALHIIGHQREISEIERILARSGKHNVLLVGEPGVGKKTCVLGFTQQIQKGRTLRPLRYKKLIQLDLGRLLSGDPSVIEAKLVAILNEAVTAGNIILFVEDIHNLFGGEQTKIGAINASEVLIPYLQSFNLQLIGTTSYQEFHKYIEPNSSLAGNFERIEVLEPSDKDTIRILEDVVPFIEARSKIMFTYEALKETVKLSKRYIANRPFPEKAIDLLDEIAVFVASKTGDKLVNPDHVQQVVSEKTKIPTGEVKESEREKLLNLESFLHQRVIDQDEAIIAIAEAMRRARAGLKTEKKPIGSFLFLGPTGVGKTETARTLAESYFGSEKSMSRLDMSEYKTPQVLDRLIGTAEGGEGILTAQIKENPFCLLLLDEIEKAAPDVLNLFLQILDEGRLTDRTGRKVDFSNTIIIATSNAGAELIRQSIKAGDTPGVLREKLLEHLQQKGIFRPEFLNRFDGVISFKPLGMQEIYQIAELILGRLAAKLKAEKEIELEVAPEAIQKLAQLGYTPEMGARPMQRVISDKVENWLAEKLLKNEIQKGQKVVFGEKDMI